MIFSFLKGEYETISYKNEKGKSIGRGITWYDESLKEFNVSYLAAKKNMYNKKMILNGTNYLVA